MIDYEKLKIAMELAEKLAFSKLVVEFKFGDGEACYFLYWLENKRMDYTTYEIDDLNAKLRELTQHEHKFKVGNTIWYLDEKNDPDYIKIDSISYFNDIVLYKSKDEHFSISHRYDLYATRNELIKSQLEYWHKLLHPEID